MAQETKHDRIVALRETGLSYRQICDLVDCDASYVSRALARHRHGGATPQDIRYEANRPPRNRREQDRAYRERKRNEALESARSVGLVHQQPDATKP